MEHKMTFDEIWEQEEQHALLHRMQAEYSVWQRRRRIRHAVLASVAVLVVVLTPFIFHLSPSNYDYVCCNRSDIPSEYWADMASNILITETI